MPMSYLGTTFTAVTHAQPNAYPPPSSLQLEAEQCTPPKPPLDAAPKGFGLGLAPKPPDTAPKAAPEDCPKVPKDGWEAAPKGALPNPKPAELAAGVLAPPKPKPAFASNRVRCLHLHRAG